MSCDSAREVEQRSRDAETIGTIREKKQQSEQRKKKARERNLKPKLTADFLQTLFDAAYATYGVHTLSEAEADEVRAVGEFARKVFGIAGKELPKLEFTYKESLATKLMTG